MKRMTVSVVFVLLLSRTVHAGTIGDFETGFAGWKG